MTSMRRTGRPVSPAAVDRPCVRRERLRLLTTDYRYLPVRKQFKLLEFRFRRVREIDPLTNLKAQGSNAPLGKPACFLPVMVGASLADARCSTALPATLPS